MASIIINRLIAETDIRRMQMKRKKKRKFPRK
jgi:hypothetical protein